MEMNSRTDSRLENFRNGFLNANSWEQRKDGPPLYLLDELTEDERKIAAKELCDAAGPGDSWPVAGLGHLRSQESLPKLYGLLSQGDPGFKIAVAHTIFLISGDRTVIRVVLEEAAKIHHLSELIDVLYLLPDFKDEKANDLLERLRNHPEYLIAYNATRALGLPTDTVVQKFRSKAAERNNNSEKRQTSSAPWWKKLLGLE